MVRMTGMPTVAGCQGVGYVRMQGCQGVANAKNLDSYMALSKFWSPPGYAFKPLPM